MELLLLALVPALTVLWLYYIQDRNREPHALVLLVFSVGFCSCAVAYPLERWCQQFFPQGEHLLLECLLIPGLIEETLKLLVVVATVWWRADFDEPLDGLIYGTAAALGFTFGEDWRYYYVHGVDASRVFSTAAHPWFSCFWAAALGMARFAPWRRGLGLVAGGLAVSALVHGLFDYCVLTAEVNPGWSWLRFLAAPLLVLLCLKMDRLITRMQGPSGGEAADEAIVLDAVEADETNTEPAFISDEAD